MRVRIGEPVDPNGTSTPGLREQIMALRADSLSESVEIACAA
jgi:hypothetical protein